MGKLIRLQFLELPELCVVGKQLRIRMEDMKNGNPIPEFWDRCFSDGTFALVEKQADYVYNPAYVGWMADWDRSDGYFTYVCGLLMKPGCPLPGEDFISRSLAPCTAAVGWIQGVSTPDVCSGAHEQTQKALEEQGYSAACLTWCMELYNCPRFTTPDENGQIILDYYIPCKPVNA